jgi:hypothetical protein
MMSKQIAFGVVTASTKDLNIYRLSTFMNESKCTGAYHVTKYID